MSIDLKKKPISKEKLEAALLHKFVIKGAWRKYHIYESDVPKGFPLELRKPISKALKDLRREGLIVGFPHGSEHVYTLNKERSKEIIEKVAKFYPDYD